MVGRGWKGVRGWGEVVGGVGGKEDGRDLGVGWDLIGGEGVGGGS